MDWIITCWAAQYDQEEKGRLNDVRHAVQFLRNFLTEGGPHCKELDDSLIQVSSLNLSNSLVTVEHFGKLSEFFRLFVPAGK